MQVPLAHAMQPSPLTLAPETSVLEAIQRMSQSEMGCVLVVERHQLIGIFTERDLLHAIAANIDLQSIPIAALMTRSLITLSATDDVVTAQKLLRQHQIHHLPVIDSQNQVLGLVTERSLLQVFDSVDMERKQAEITLQASNQRLISTFESIPAGFQALDQAWRFTYVNQRAETLLQRSRQDLLGQNVWDLFPEIVGTAFEQEFYKAVSQRVAVNFEAFYPALNVWFEVHAHPIADGLFIYYQDVTERRRFYDQLQHQAQREQALNRVIQVIRNSLDLNTVFATATAEIAQLLRADRVDILQHQAARAVWQSMSDYYQDPDMESILGMEFADDPNEPIAQLKRLQVVQIPNIAEHPDRSVSQYAQLLPGTWLVVPIHFDGQLWGCLASIRNHQWRWQDAEVELATAVVDQLAIAIQQSQLYQRVWQLNETLESQVQERTAQLRKALDYEALLKRITDRVRDSLDEQHILQTTVQELAVELDVICCDTALYNTEQTITTICYEAIRSDDFTAAKGTSVPIEQVADINQQVLKGQWMQFCTLRDPIDSVRRISYKYAVLSCPLIDNQGALGEMWLFRPCSEWFTELEIRLVQQVANQCAIAVRQSRLYQAAQAQVNELEQLNYLKDDFLSSVSHELRTPMSNIKMATQMLEIILKQAGVFMQEPDRVSRYFKVLQDECQREINLINDLLDLSRVESGSDPLTITTQALHHWLPKIVEAFVDRIHNQQQRLVLHVPDDLSPLTTDFSYLERAITELVQNACKYTPPGETIRVFANATAAGLQIHVSNTGVEIAAGELERIFDKFYRIPNSDPWKHGGTGLGLALVKRLLDRLGAEITVESVNHQTTFTIQCNTAH